MRSAAGTFGNPGMVMMSPVSATMNPAPALTFSWRTLSVKPLGAPSSVALSENEYCVLAMQMGSPPKPRSVSCFICFFASGLKVTPSPR